MIIYFACSDHFQLRSILACQDMDGYRSIPRHGSCAGAYSKFYFSMYLECVCWFSGGYHKLGIPVRNDAAYPVNTRASNIETAEAKAFMQCVWRSSTAYIFFALFLQFTWESHVWLNHIAVQVPNCNGWCVHVDLHLQQVHCCMLPRSACFEALSKQRRWHQPGLEWGHVWIPRSFLDCTVHWRGCAFDNPSSYTQRDSQTGPPNAGWCEVWSWTSQSSSVL